MAVFVAGTVTLYHCLLLEQIIPTTIAKKDKLTVLYFLCCHFVSLGSILGRKSRINATAVADLITVTCKDHYSKQRKIVDFVILVLLLVPEVLLSIHLGCGSLKTIRFD